MRYNEKIEKQHWCTLTMCETLSLKSYYLIVNRNEKNNCPINSAILPLAYLISLFINDHSNLGNIKCFYYTATIIRKQYLFIAMVWM